MKFNSDYFQNKFKINILLELNNFYFHQQLYQVDPKRGQTGGIFI